jgi:hypothetical protein
MLANRFLPQIVGPTLSPLPCSQIDFCLKSSPSLPEDTGDYASHTAAALHPAPSPLYIPRCCPSLPAPSPPAAARRIARALVQPHRPDQPSSAMPRSARKGASRPAGPPPPSSYLHYGRLWSPASRGADRPGRGGRHRRPRAAAARLRRLAPLLARIRLNSRCGAPIWNFGSIDQ